MLRPDGWYFAWQNEARNWQHVVAIKNVTGNNIICDVPAEVLERICVYFLVDAIPPAGLVEAVESLQGIAEFHEATATLPAAVPSRMTKVRVTGRIKSEISPIPAE